MSILKKPYEIFIWEGDGENEQIIATIGSNTMESQAKAFSPSFKRNINGSKELTFKMYYRYIDNTTGEWVENFFVPLLKNESRIGLNYEGKRYDFIIKNISEQKSNYTFSYQATDLYINELSKNGYGVTLDVELENNTDTVVNLAKTVLDGSGWEVDEENSETIPQLTEEPLLEVTNLMVDNFIFYQIHEKDNGEIDKIEELTPDKFQFSGKYPLYFFWSSLKDKDERRISFIYKEGSSFTTDEKRNVIEKKCQYYFDLPADWEKIKVGDYWIPQGKNISGTLINGFDVVSVSQKYRGKRYVFSQKTSYNPVLKKWVKHWQDEPEVGSVLTIGEKLDSENNWYPCKITKDLLYQSAMELKKDEIVYVRDAGSYIVFTKKEYDSQGKLIIYQNSIGAFSQNNVKLNASDLVYYYDLEKNDDDVGFGIPKYFQPFYLVHSYTDTEYISPNLIHNYITNSAFKSTDGWRGARFGDSVNKGNKDDNAIVEAKTNPDYVESWKTGKAENNGEGESTITPIFTPILSLTFPTSNSVVTNSGFYDSRSELDNFYAGQEWILECQSDAQLAQGELKFFVADSNYNKEGYYTPISDKEILKFEYFKNMGTSKLFKAMVSSNYFETKEDFLKKKYQLFIQSSEEKFSCAFSKFEIYPFVPDAEGNPLSPEKQLQDASDATAKGEIIDTIVRTKTHYFLPEQNKDAQKPEDFKYVEVTTEPYDYLKYSPVYLENAEKIKSVTVSKSNYFNIIQKIAETFECWAEFLIGRDTSGKLTKKVAFKNFMENPNYAGVKYGINLKDIKRTLDSKAIVSKLIVPDAVNEFGKNGICSIQRAKGNETGEDYIYDFSYYINHGLMKADQLQKDLYDETDAIGEDVNKNEGETNSNGYYSRLRRINDKLDSLGTEYQKYSTPLLRAQADLNVAEVGLTSATEEHAEAITDFEDTFGIPYNYGQDAEITEEELELKKYEEFTVLSSTEECFWQDAQVTQNFEQHIIKTSYTTTVKKYSFNTETNEYEQNSSQEEVELTTGTKHLFQFWVNSSNNQVIRCLDVNVEKKITGYWSVTLTPKEFEIFKQEHFLTSVKCKPMVVAPDIGLAHHNNYYYYSSIKYWLSEDKKAIFSNYNLGVRNREIEVANIQTITDIGFLQDWTIELSTPSIETRVAEYLSNHVGEKVENLTVHLLESVRGWLKQSGSNKVPSTQTSTLTATKGNSNKYSVIKKWTIKNPDFLDFQNTETLEFIEIKQDSSSNIVVQKVDDIILELKPEYENSDSPKTKPTPVEYLFITGEDEQKNEFSFSTKLPSNYSYCCRAGKKFKANRRTVAFDNAGKIGNTYWLTSDSAFVAENFSYISKGTYAYGWCIKHNKNTSSCYSNLYASNNNKYYYTAMPEVYTLPAGQYLWMNDKQEEGWRTDITNNAASYYFKYTIKSLSSEEILLQSEKFKQKTPQQIYDEAGEEKKKKLAAALSKIGSLNATLSSFQKQKEQSESLVNQYSAKIDAIVAEEEKLLKQKKTLNDVFYKKYYQFISEGTWIQQDYTDDDKFFIDAQSVAYNSAMPKVTYQIDVLELSSVLGYEDFSYALADKTWVEDPEYFGYKNNGDPYREEIVITEKIDWLDEPDKSTLKVQNYKNQFQDLFQRITATTQQVNYSNGAWQKAAAFATADTSHQSEFLNGALQDAKTVLKNMGEQSVTWDKSGLTITDLAQGGVLRLVGGAILIGDANEATGWRTALTKNGISANLITAGQVDVGKVRIMNGSDSTFIWDHHGITAFRYGFTPDGEVKNPYLNNINPNKWVRFDQNGFYGISGKDGTTWVPSSVEDVVNNSVFSFTWEGVNIKKTTEGRDGSYQLALSTTDNYFIRGQKVTSEGVENIFSIDIFGNAFFKGKIEAESGKIGGWNLEYFNNKNLLYSSVATDGKTTYYGLRLDDNMKNDSDSVFYVGADEPGIGGKLSIEANGDLNINGANFMARKSLNNSFASIGYILDGKNDRCVLSFNDAEILLNNSGVEINGSDITLNGTITANGSITAKKAVIGKDYGNQTGVAKSNSIFNAIDGEGKSYTKILFLGTVTVTEDGKNVKYNYYLASYNSSVGSSVGAYIVYEKA